MSFMDLLYNEDISNEEMLSQLYNTGRHFNSDASTHSPSQPSLFLPSLGYVTPGAAWDPPLPINGGIGGIGGIDAGLFNGTGWQPQQFITHDNQLGSTAVNQPLPLSSAPPGTILPQPGSLTPPVPNVSPPSQSETRESPAAAPSSHFTVVRNLAPSASPISALSNDTSRAIEDGNNSSWRTRNPDRPALHVHRSTAEENAKRATRRISANQKKAKEETLNNALQKIVEEHNEKIVELATEHDVTVDKVTKLITGLTHYKKTREVSLANALIFAKAREVNSDDTGGPKYTLSELRQLVANDPTLQNLTEEEKQRYKDDLRQCREEKGTSVRATNNAVACDVRATLSHVFQTLNGLAVRTGCFATMFLTRSHVFDIHDATWYGTDNAMDFWEDVMGLEPDEILKKFELWGVSQGTSIAQRDTMENMQRDCQRMIRSSFRAVTSKTTRLTYVDFEVTISLKHGVNKKGWPEGVPFTSPYKISTIDQVRQLRDVLKSQQCYFYKMTTRERQALRASIEARQKAGEVVRRARKKRTDAGTTRAGKRKNSNDNSQPAKRARTTLPVPKSREIIDDSDEDGSEEASGGEE